MIEAICQCLEKFDTLHGRGLNGMTRQCVSKGVCRVVYTYGYKHSGLSSYDPHYIYIYIYIGLLLTASLATPDYASAHATNQ